MKTAEVVVLGTDTLLAALPATSVQMVHACLAAGFDAAVPSSWGDELVAAACLRELSTREAGPVIQCSCPCVARRLTNGGSELEPFLLPLESPPVAVARYIRALYGSAPVQITFAGACPAGADSLIDRALGPAEFLALLAEREVFIGDQPVVFDSILPPDRRRHRSLPGGVPTAEALQEHAPGRVLVEIAADAFAAELAEHLLKGDSVLLDLAPRLGCACSGSVAQIGARQARSVVCSLEPPRSSTPIVDLAEHVRLRTTPRELAAVARQPDDCTTGRSQSSGWHNERHSGRQDAGKVPEEQEAQNVQDVHDTHDTHDAHASEPDDSNRSEHLNDDPRPARSRTRPELARPRPSRGVPRTYALARATSGRHRSVPDPMNPDRDEAAVGLATPPDSPATENAPAPEYEAHEEAPRHPEESTATSAEFDGFLDEVRLALETTISDWRGQLRVAVAEWTSRGFSTGILERAIVLPRKPDVTGLLTTFKTAADHLVDLEKRALSLAPELGERLVGHPVFRDPARVADAELIVKRLADRAEAAANATGPAAAAEAAPLEGDAAAPALVYDWMMLEELLIEDMSESQGFFRPQNGLD
ncbi:MAG TPA: [Fe-Fe] hydrogenase large subunit C-terminal domain-containing protein [Gemmatimonadales bacterium]|nr:[Fe-Fe] hydrogenase large subunit C-terminal domain-containing protein [Gemmatimonadales bacterium]